MPESGKQDIGERKGMNKVPQAAVARRDTDDPIPKPTTDLGFRGIRHMRRYDSVSRRRTRDN